MSIIIITINHHHHSSPWAQKAGFWSDRSDSIPVLGKHGVDVDDGDGVQLPPGA